MTAQIRPFVGLVCGEQNNRQFNHSFKEGTRKLLSHVNNFESHEDILNKFTLFILTVATRECLYSITINLSH